MSDNPNDTQTEASAASEKLTHLYAHKLDKLQRIDKILETRLQAAIEKNGYDKRARKIELAWNLMTARIIKIYHKLYVLENETD